MNVCNQLTYHKGILQFQFLCVWYDSHGVFLYSIITQKQCWHVKISFNTSIWCQ